MRARLAFAALIPLAACAPSLDEGTNALDAGTTAPDAGDVEPDAGTAPGDDEGLDCDFDPGYVHSAGGAVLQLLSEEACVRVERRDDSVPGTIYKQVPYTLLRFVVDSARGREDIVDEDALRYQSSHHNWADRAYAEGAQLRYELRLDYGDTDGEWGYRYTLSGLEDGELVLGPFELTPAAE